MKAYDRAYYDRWYRDRRHAVVDAGLLARRVSLAVATAEYFLERPLRRVLDVGCGEAPWRAALRRMRPGVRYTGVESSTYALQRFGRRRGIVRGSLATLGALRLKGKFDLVVCSDVLHYVSDAEVAVGLLGIARLLQGVAFIEAFAREDEIEGDREGLAPRPAAMYVKLLRAAGLVPVGLHCYVNRAQATALPAIALESAAPRAFKER